MVFAFELPDVGEGVAEGELLEWHVAPGDTVAEDQVLAEVETDKAVVDLPSPVAGTVLELHAEPGEVVPVGDVVITIETDEEAADASDSSADDPVAETSAADSPDGARAASGGVRVFAPPNVRRLACELDVDIADVTGSGAGGRVTERDVRAAADGAEQDISTGGISDDGSSRTAAATPSLTDEPSPAAGGPTVDEAASAEGPTTGGESVGSVDRDRTLATPATRALARELGVDVDAVPTEKTRDGEAFVEAADVRAVADGATPPATASTGETPGEEAPSPTPARTVRGEGVGDVTTEPYRGIRRTIGERMEESAFTAAHVTHHDTAVVPRLVDTREVLAERASERGVSLTYLPFVLKAVVEGLQAYPVLNSTLDEEAGEIRYRHYYDLGVAVATASGLLVPVVENVDEKGMLELAADIESLAADARAGELPPEKLRGSTFTVTNFGAVGGEYATPIINYPETAILGLGRLEERPVAEEGTVVARPTLPLSLSIDHRVIDGAEAAQFVNTVKEYLENPSLLLLD